MFGNRPFFEWIRQYDIQKMTIPQKYKTVAVKYYRDRLNHDVLGGMNPDFLARPTPNLQEGRMTKKQLNAAHRPA